MVLPTNNYRLLSVEFRELGPSVVNIDSSIDRSGVNLGEKLPPSEKDLSEELRKIMNELFSREKVEELENIILKVREEITLLNLPYHNWQHTFDVALRAHKIAVMCDISLEERGVLLVAALLHDIGHAGRTHRQLADPKVVDRTDLSNEEYAALRADELTKDFFTEDQRLLLKSLILATTFGQNQRPEFIEEEKWKDIERKYSPVTELEMIIALSDVGGFMNGFEHWEDESFRVLKETEPAQRQETLEILIGQRLAFLNFVETRLNNVIAVMPVEQREKNEHVLSENLTEIRDRLIEIRDEPNSEYSLRAREKFNQIVN